MNVYITESRENCFFLIWKTLNMDTFEIFYKILLCTHTNFLPQNFFYTSVHKYGKNLLASLFWPWKKFMYVCYHLIKYSRLIDAIVVLQNPFCGRDFQYKVAIVPVRYLFTWKARTRPSNVASWYSASSRNQRDHSLFCPPGSPVPRQSYRSSATSTARPVVRSRVLLSTSKSCCALC